MILIKLIIAHYYLIMLLYHYNLYYTFGLHVMQIFIAGIIPFDCMCCALQLCTLTLNQVSDKSYTIFKIRNKFVINILFKIFYRKLS